MAARGNLFFCGGSVFEATRNLKVGDVPRPIVMVEDRLLAAGEEGSILQDR